MPAAGRLVNDQAAPLVLVRPSYPRLLLPRAGTPDPMPALMTMATFGPTTPPSVRTRVTRPPAGSPIRPLVRRRRRSLFLNTDTFSATVTTDVAANAAAFVTEAPVTWDVHAPGGTVALAATRTDPTWCLMACGNLVVPAAHLSPLAEQRATAVRAVATGA